MTSRRAVWQLGSRGCANVTIRYSPAGDNAPRETRLMSKNNRTALLGSAIGFPMLGRIA
jgi:hypothetical protein